MKIHIEEFKDNYKDPHFLTVLDNAKKADWFLMVNNFILNELSLLSGIFSFFEHEACGTSLDRLDERKQCAETWRDAWMHLMSFFMDFATSPQNNQKILNRIEQEMKRKVHQYDQTKKEVFPLLQVILLYLEQDEMEIIDGNRSLNPHIKIWRLALPDTKSDSPTYKEQKHKSHEH